MYLRVIPVCVINGLFFFIAEQYSLAWKYATCHSGNGSMPYALPLYGNQHTTVYPVILWRTSTVLLFLIFSNYEQSCCTFCVYVFGRTCFDSVEWGWTYLLSPIMMQLFNIQYEVGCRFFVDVIYLSGYRGSLIYPICWVFKKIHE